VAAQQNNLPVLYSCCTSFFIGDVHREFGLINVHLFNILPAILSINVGGKSIIFSVWSVITPSNNNNNSMTFC